MKKIIFFLILILLVAAVCHGGESDTLTPPEYPNGLFLELGGGRNPDSSWGELGFLGAPSELIEYRASIGYLGLETSEKNYYSGFNLGTRIKYSSFISPFIGAGIFSGYSFENDEEDAENKDSNDDQKKIDDFIFCFYPEAGLYFQFENGSKIYFSAKYLISSEKEADNFYLFTIGFSFSYEEETLNF